MPTHEVEKVPEPILTSSSVYTAAKLKRLAEKEKVLTPADLVSEYSVAGRRIVPKREKSYEQGEKAKEDEKLAMEVKGVKDAEKKPRKPRAKKADKQAAVAIAAADSPVAPVAVTAVAAPVAEKKPRKSSAKKQDAAAVADSAAIAAAIKGADAVQQEKIVQAAEKKAQKVIRKARFEKGSPEAIAWGKMMAESRKKK
jgi:hypothetical protein